MKTTERINGFEFPAPAHAVRGQFSSRMDLDAAIARCRGHRVAVQAGGNVGVWPAYLAARFEVVYTFEPATENFNCLARNCPDSNILKFQAALGFARGCIGMAYDPDPKGRRFMSRGFVQGPGMVPVLRIDDLGLRACDLIQLDIEGAEPDALQGALETIRAHCPVLMVEDKGHSERYGHLAGWPEPMLAPLGYRLAARVGQDSILVAGAC